MEESEAVSEIKEISESLQKIEEHESEEENMDYKSEDKIEEPKSKEVPQDPEPDKPTSIIEHSKEKQEMNEQQEKHKLIQKNHIKLNTSKNKYIVFSAITVVVILLLSSFFIGYMAGNSPDSESPDSLKDQDSDNDGLSDEKEKELGTDPNNPDSDGDGYLDGFEIENGMNPLEPEMIYKNKTIPIYINNTEYINITQYSNNTIFINKTINQSIVDTEHIGIVLYEPSIANNFPESLKATYDFKAILITRNIDQDKSGFIIPLLLKGTPNTYNGSFKVSKIENTDFFSVESSVKSDSKIIVDNSVVKNKPEQYLFQNLDITIPKSIGIVNGDHTFGYGTEDEVMYVGLEETPAYLTDVEMSGILLPNDFYDILESYIHVNLDNDWAILKQSLSSTAQMPDNCILTNDIQYVSTRSITNTIIGDVIIGRSFNDIKQDILTEAECILGLGFENIEFIYNYLQNTEMQVIVMNEQDNPTDFWVIILNSNIEIDTLNGIVTLDNVNSIQRTRISTFLGKAVPSVVPDFGGSVNFAVCADNSPSIESYQSKNVKDLWTMGMLATPSPVSIDSYFTWTTATDILNSVAENQGVNTQTIEGLKNLTGYTNPTFSFIIERDVTITGSENDLNDVIKNIAIGISPAGFNIEQALLQGEIKGVVYNLGDLVENTNYDMPFILIDQYNIYDNLHSIHLSDLDSSYQVDSINENMVKVEGYVVGTTLKTIADTLSNIPQLSFFEVIAYLPFDIGIYDFSYYDNNSKTLYHLPIVQIVKGKGITYFGEKMEVWGWFNINSYTKDIFNSLKNGFNEKNLPLFLRDYIFDYILNNKILDMGIREYIQTHFQANITNEIKSFLQDYSNDLKSRITNLENDFCPDWNFINNITNNLDLLKSEILEDIGFLTDLLNDTISNIDFIGSFSTKIDNLMNTIDSLRAGNLSNNRTKIINEIGKIGYALNELINARMNFTGFLNQSFENTTLLHNNIDRVRNILYDIDNFTSLIAEKFDIILKEMITQIFNGDFCDNLSNMIFGNLKKFIPGGSFFDDYLEYIFKWIENETQREKSFIQMIDNQIYALINATIFGYGYDSSSIIELSHPGKVMDVDFHPNGKYLASASFGDTLKGWNTTSWNSSTISSDPSIYDDYYMCVAFSRRGNYVGYGYYSAGPLMDYVIAIRNCSDGTPDTWPIERGWYFTSNVYPKTMCFSYDERYCAVGLLNGTVVIFNLTDSDPSNWTIEKYLSPHASTHYYYGLEFSHNDTHLLGVGDNDATGYVDCWTVNNWDLTRSLSYGSKCRAITFMNCGDSFALGFGNDICIFNYTDFIIGSSSHYNLSGHQNIVRSLSFIDNDNILASGSYDRRVIMWNTTSNSIFQIIDTGDQIRSLNFSYGQDILAVALLNDTIKVYNFTKFNNSFIPNGYGSWTDYVNEKFTFISTVKNDLNEFIYNLSDQYQNITDNLNKFFELNQTLDNIEYNIGLNEGFIGNISNLIDDLINNTDIIGSNLNNISINLDELIVNLTDINNSLITLDLDFGLLNGNVTNGFNIHISQVIDDIRNNLNSSLDSLFNHFKNNVSINLDLWSLPFMDDNRILGFISNSTDMIDDMVDFIFGDLEFYDIFLNCQQVVHIQGYIHVFKMEPR